MSSLPPKPRPALLAATVLSAALAGLVFLPATVSATDRRFTYAYGSGVLEKGGVEIEPWTTVRIGRESHYVRFDERVEFEFGLTDRVQTAWYLNWKALSQGIGDEIVSSFEFVGVSNEWKWKLSDPVADPLGFGLYAEWGAGPTEVELEGKVLIDKQIGPLLIAYNFIGEYEFEFEEPGEIEDEVEIENVLGVAVLPRPFFSIGAEFRTHTEIVPGEGYEHTAFFLGPTVSASGKSAWVAVSVLPQLGAHKAPEHAGDGKLDLHEHERVEGRVLCGFHVK
jgi:hypothetical protein